MYSCWCHQLSQQNKWWTVYVLANHGYVETFSFLRLWRCCACGIVRFRHRKHWLGSRKKSCFGLKYMLWLKLTQLEMSWCLVLSPRTWLVMIQSNVKNIRFFFWGGGLFAATNTAGNCLMVSWKICSGTTITNVETQSWTVVTSLAVVLHTLACDMYKCNLSVFCALTYCSSVFFFFFVCFFFFFFFTSRVAHIYDLGDTCTYVLCLRVFHFNYVKNNLTRSSSQDLSDVFCVPLGGSKPPGWKLA